MGYEFAQRLKSSWLKADSANIIVWHHRILEAYYSPEFDEEQSAPRTVSLIRHVPYEVRLVELPRNASRPQLTAQAAGGVAP